MSASLNPSARCFGLAVGDEIVSFAGILHRPNSRGQNNIKGIARTVTLPDWQGLGLAFVLTDLLGAAYRAQGFKLRTYPAHPSLIRSRNRSPNWTCVMAAGRNLANPSSGTGEGVVKGGFGGRPNAVFEYCGPKLDREEADRLIGAQT